LLPGVHFKEVFMRFFFSFWAIALFATGCASTTTSVRQEAEASLRVPPPRRSVPAASRSGPVSVNPATCSTLAESVARNHPRIRALEARGQAALFRSRSEEALPAPKLSFEVWDFPIGEPSRADAEGMYMVGIGQEFGPPGARDGRARAEAEEARAIGGELSEAYRELRAEVARACTSWNTAESIRRRLIDHRDLLKEMRAAMIARYRTGGESLGIVTRADAELAAADRHVAEAEEEVAVARATLLALAATDGLPKIPPPLGRSRTKLDVERLLSLAKSARGEFAVAEARKRSASARYEAARAEARAPTFEIEATYMQAPSMRAGLGAMVSMSLPWLSGGASNQRASAEHEARAAAADTLDVTRKVRVEVVRAAGQVKALDRSLAVLREREIPAAHRALDAERASLSAGDFNLASWIQAGHAVREAHIDEARIQGALENAWIDLEASVGQSLGQNESGR
jgi:outer membrane protein TolC